ncbi:MAG: heavy metal transporter [Actinomycetota bacterium]|nr:heavy metal transporter [Actinomycetota bacterium]
MQRRAKIILLAVGMLVLVLVATVVTLIVRHGSTAAGPECQVPAHGKAAAVELDAVQLQNAATISAVGLSRGLPLQARTIAIATALQESGLRNLDHGDRDSLGLFQQRHSQGWGTTAQIMDPVYASGRFYDALVKVPNWQRKPLTQAAQAVQFSGFPDAYAKWETEATGLAVALGGTAAASLRCRAGAVAPTADAPVRVPPAGTGKASSGLRTLLAAANAELGGIRVAQLDAGGRSATMTIALPGLTATAAGRALAAWMVAHATGFGIAGVRVDDRSYSGHSWSGRPAGTAPLAGGTVAVTVG